MGLETVVEEIRTNSRKEAEKIRAASQADVRAILTMAQERAEKIKLSAEESVTKQISHVMSQEISAANLVVKRELLNTQKGLLDQVYSKTLAAIVALPQSFHEEALSHLLSRARAQIPEGIVRCGSRDVRSLDEILAKGGFPGYRRGDPVEIEGGILVESKNRELQLDFSYRTFLGQVWETGLKDASDLLFG
jgi:V/A-type H+-transporting ATPase subunit E